MTEGEKSAIRAHEYLYGKPGKLGGDHKDARIVELKELLSEALWWIDIDLGKDLRSRIDAALRRVE